jgi:hypothetical protein
VLTITRTRPAGALVARRFSSMSCCHYDRGDRARGEGGSAWWLDLDEYALRHEIGGETLPAVLTTDP